MPVNHLVNEDLQSWKVSLLEWFATVQRPMPWRLDRSPYRTLVSEMMLQQTQVATVIPYFEKWVNRWPSIELLAEAQEDEILAMWAGLGYYRRARNLQACAKYIAEFGWPDSAEALQANLKGVGAYTAGAIASIGFGLDAPIVDGNVERVYSRFNNDDSVGAQLHRNAWSWARRILPEGQAASWNQGLMELGSLVCTPKSPKCSECPLNSKCLSLKANVVNQRPTQVAKPGLNQLNHLIIVPKYQGLVGLELIKKGQWWEGMWQFPRRENTPENFEILTKWLQLKRVDKLCQFKHSVTNNRIQVEAFVGETDSRNLDLKWCEPGEVDHLPIPASIKKINQMVKSSWFDGGNLGDDDLPSTLQLNYE